jgi:predicted DNA-binding ribbon-helix-helix protein
MSFPQYQSRLVSRNIRINGHRTSIRLEPELWAALEKVCLFENKPLNDICSHIAARCHASSFTSAVRVYILTYYERRLASMQPAPDFDTKIYLNKFASAANT